MRVNNDTSETEQYHSASSNSSVTTQDNYISIPRLREGTFFLGRGGLGPQRGGSSVKVSPKRGGPYLM